MGITYTGKLYDYETSRAVREATIAALSRAAIPVLREGYDICVPTSRTPLRNRLGEFVVDPPSRKGRKPTGQPDRFNKQAADLNEEARIRRCYEERPLPPHPDVRNGLSARYCPPPQYNLGIKPGCREQPSPMLRRVHRDIGQLRVHPANRVSSTAASCSIDYTARAAKVRAAMFEHAAIVRIDMPARVELVRRPSVVNAAKDRANLLSTKVKSLFRVPSLRR